MARFKVGDEVRVVMPHAPNKRGVMGVHPMYTTLPEAKFDGAVGTITEIDPEGDRGIALYLVDFQQHDNWGIPWGVQWFRQNWIFPADAPVDQKVNAIA